MDMIRTGIRHKIEADKIKQAYFSARIGVKPSNFNAFLNGTRSLPYATLIHALELLDLSVGTAGAHTASLPPTELPEIFKSHVSVSGMKIKDIAEKAGIDNTCLTTFLNGYRNMPVKNMEKVMTVLHLDVVPYKKRKKKTE